MKAINFLCLSVVLITCVNRVISLPITQEYVTQESWFARNKLLKQNKTDESINAFIQRAREIIKLRDFLQSFYAIAQNTKTKDFSSTSEDVHSKDDGRIKLNSTRRKRDTLNIDSSADVIDNESQKDITSTAESNAKSPSENTQSGSISNGKSQNGDKVDNFKNSNIYMGNSNSKFRNCIHKYNNVAHNVGEKTDFIYEYDGIDDTDYSDRDTVLSNMTLPSLGNVQVEHCARPGFCYALWSQDEDGSIIILGQGCWESSDIKQTCSRSECRSEGGPTKISPPRNFCCCQTDLCNASPISSAVEEELVTSDESAVLVSTEPSFKASTYGLSVSLFGVCVGALLLIIIFRLLCKQFQNGSSKNVDANGGETSNMLEAGGPGFSCSNMCVDNLKLHDNIGEGKHGKVWRGSLGGVAVAVKAMPSCKAAIWSRERDIYCLPHMTHPNLLTYFGCDSRSTLDGSTEHLLVLQLAPLGSLRQYLINNTLDWDSYTKMALGIASALAHLHTQIDKNDQYKPCVVHRDVNSSNILVRADLSCCLSDLGLAMAIPDCRKKYQQPKIQEAGTLRYLAPEALEGAFDLRRCDAALRAVDIYALALVLWELLSRCAPAHRHPGPQPYASPYHAEVGDHPTLEQMQVVVVRRKARPLFSTRLLNTRAARLAKDTCEDCWDHDAEARLTALCIVERLTELRNLKPVPSPTINSNDLRPPVTNEFPTSHSPSSTENKNSNLLSSTNNGNISSIFEFEAMQNQPIQPHQGRNPCLERNLASAGPEDRLIDKSLKEMTSNSNSSSSGHGYGSNEFRRVDPNLTEANLRVEEPQDFSRVEEQHSNSVGLGYATRFHNNTSSTTIDADIDLSVDELLIARPSTPIGYVQNDVAGENCNGSSILNKKDNIKQTNLKVDRGNKWSTKHIKKLFDGKLFKRKNPTSRPIPLETEVNLILANGKPINNDSRAVNGHVRTSVILNRETHNGTIQNSLTNIDSFVGRPSSLPGLDSIASSSSRDVSVGADDNWKNISNLNESNMCTLSPPNQTISMTTIRQNCNENLIGGYKVLPNGVNGSNSLNKQVFAVIVPRTININNNINQNKEVGSSDWKNEKILLNHETHCKSGLKFDKTEKTNKEVVIASSSGSGMSKRHSCDEKILLPGNKLGIADSKIDGNFSVLSNDKTIRNSYSGEFEMGHLAVNENSENFDPNMMDYSSNSEDEHMLLLAENGGSKITMRPRFDIKAGDSKTKKKTKHGSNVNVPGSNGSLTKIAAGSFNSICNKYGSKNKYENFENENSGQLINRGSNSNVASIEDLRRKSAVINRNDVSVINLVRNGSALSLYKNEIDDTSCKYFDMTVSNCPTNDFTPDGSNLTDGSLNEHNEENDSSSDDSTLRDTISLQETKTPRPLSIKQNLSRQHSLELVTELFSSSGDISRLKDPANRIKTPGDVPASVRRIRGHKRALSMKTKVKPNPLNRLSLYDDRIMFGNSL